MRQVLDDRLELAVAEHRGVQQHEPAAGARLAVGDPRPVTVVEEPQPHGDGSSQALACAQRRPAPRRAARGIGIEQPPGDARRRGRRARRRRRASAPRPCASRRRGSPSATAACRVAAGGRGAQALGGALQPDAEVLQVGGRVGVAHAARQPCAVAEGDAPRRPRQRRDELPRARRCSSRAARAGRSRRRRAGRRAHRPWQRVASRQPTRATYAAAMARSPYDRQILRLAVPALGALAAEPAYLLADTAIVGHLGTKELAALALAATVLSVARRAVQLPRLRDDRAGRAAARRRPGRARRRARGAGAVAGARDRDRRRADLRRRGRADHGAARRRLGRPPTSPRATCGSRRPAFPAR